MLLYFPKESCLMMYALHQNKKMKKKRKVKIKSDGKFIACRFIHGIFFVKDNFKR